MTGLQDAYKAEKIFLAVPFSAHKDVAKQFKQWNGKIVLRMPFMLLRKSWEVSSLLKSCPRHLSGARLVKAFNRLAAAQLGTNPSLEGQRQAVLVSSNDADARATVATVATQLGFAPVELGRLDQGGVPPHVLGGQPGGLLFQNLVKPG